MCIACKDDKGKVSLYISKAFFILLGGKLVHKLCIPVPVTKCQDFVELPTSESKISSPLANSDFPFGSAAF